MYLKTSLHKPAPLSLFASKKNKKKNFAKYFYIQAFCDKFFLKRENIFYEDIKEKALRGGGGEE